MAEVRSARPEDVKPLGELWSTLVRYSPPPGRRWEHAPDAADRWMDHLRRRFLEEEDGCALVAEANGEVVGYATARLAEKPPIYAHRRVLVFDTVAVRGAQQGRGIGRQLVEGALRWGAARGAGSAQITTSWHNLTARAAWKAMGFAEAMLTMSRDLEAEG